MKYLIFGVILALTLITLIITLSYFVKKIRIKWSFAYPYSIGKENVGQIFKITNVKNDIFELILMIKTQKGELRETELSNTWYQVPCGFTNLSIGTNFKVSIYNQKIYFDEI